MDNSTPSLYGGVLSALITPFNEHNKIDTHALRELVKSQIRDGVHGFVVAGTTGEAATLSIDERKLLVQSIKEEMPKTQVIAGAGANATDSAIELQKAMEDAGADATLQVVPFYNKPTQAGLYKHFSSIAKNATAPIILYNVKSRTGADLLPETVCALACEHQNIVGIKEATTDVERIVELTSLLKGQRPEFSVLSGEDKALLAFLALGGDGIISVSSQVAGFEMVALYNSFMRGDYDYAQKITYKINDVCSLMFRYVNPIPVKTVLSKLGYCEKNFRLPLCSLDEHEEEKLLSTLREFDFLKVLKNKDSMNG